MDACGCLCSSSILSLWT
uniref:Uncharacterized protein n=1 Tax=Anguilla anguilla TaxID=7936 RepID=A0A0E9U6Y5_ANGAN